MTDDRTPLEQTAAHEAGHAIVAFFLGRAFRSVTVIPDGDVLGAVHSMPPGDWFRPDLSVTTRGRLLIEQRVMISLAGFEAEEAWLRRHTGRDATPAELDMMAVQSEQDRHNAVTMAMYACGSAAECEAFLEWLRQRVLGKLNHPRYEAMSDAIIAALIERGQLTWRDAKDTMRTAMFNRRGVGAEVHIVPR